MKLEVDRYSIYIIPENKLEVAYFEEVLGLKSKNSRCIGERKSISGLENTFAFLKLSKENE